MLTRAIIRNFQSLKDVDIALGPITAIVGHSDVGKSALVRAINALVVNRTSDSLMHKGKGPLHIELHTDDGYIVTLTRPKGASAFYTVKKHGEKAKQYDKTGREVPDDVSDAIRMREYQIDKDIRILPSIHTQLGPQFLIQHTDTTVSKTVGRISNISVVFGAIRKASADLVSVQQDVSTLQAELTRVTDDLKPLEDIDKRETAVAALTRARDKAQALEAALVRASALADDISATNQKLAALESELLAAANITDALDNLNSRLSRLQTARDLHNSIVNTNSQMQRENGFVSASAAVVRSIDTHVANLYTLVSLVTARNSMESTRAENNRLARIAKEESAELDKLEETIRQTTESLRVCPLIHAPFKPGCVDSLVQLTRTRGAA